MRKLALLVCVVIAGCDNAIFDDAIRRAVRESLKDPGSAKFEKALEYQNHACIFVNAKNGFGAYAGKSAAYLRTYGAGIWHVDRLDGSSCDLEDLKALQAIDEKEKAMEAEVFALSKKHGLISKDLQSIVDLKAKGVCSELVADTMTHYRIAIREGDPGDREKWMQRYRYGLEQIVAATCKAADADSNRATNGNQQ